MTTGNPYAPWYEHDVVVFDVETTGLGDDDRVVEVGLARFERGEFVSSWGSLVHPGMEIPAEATGIHGISNEDVADAPDFLHTLHPLIRIARDAWPVAYNATFDKRLLTQEMGRLNLTDISVPIFDPNYRWLDPLIWLRHFDGLWGKNKLTVACKRYGVSLEGAHRATNDAVAAGRLLFEAVREKVPPITICEMLRRQDILQERQDDERRAWFEKKGIAYQ